MSSRRIGFLGAVLVLFSSAAWAQAPKAAAAAPAGEDKYPNGCVDCHKGDNDLLTKMAPLKTAVPPELAALAKKAAPEGITLKGKHPDVSAKKNIPQDCLTCHKADSKMAPPLSRLAHLIHLAGGEKSDFVTKYGGTCTSCHKLNADTGVVALKMPPKK